MSNLREPLQVEDISKLDPDTPVVMVNLMKFREQSLDGDGTGWDAYVRYSKHTVKLLKLHGATIIWAGSIETAALGINEGDWDYTALVWYPRPSAFLEMMQSAEYAIGNVHRENGTEDHLILATKTNLVNFAPFEK